MLKVTGVTKSYGGIAALQDVTAEFSGGEVHALLGENGAGKSTFVKILAGVVRPDEGSVQINGNVIDLGQPQVSQRAGIGVVFQELSLIPQLSVAQNIFLGREVSRGGLIASGRQLAATKALLDRFGMGHIRPDTPVEQLSLSEQQMIEIIKIVSRDPQVLILDEATSALGSREVELVTRLVGEMKSAGKVIILISHRFDEVWSLADRITVLRDGKSVGGGLVSEIGHSDAVRMMAGHDVESVLSERAEVTHERVEVFRIDSLCLWPHSHREISLCIKRGEILGLGGLQGQGQQEFLQWIFGAYKAPGNIVIDEEVVSIKSPKHALSRGIAMLPEDRKTQALHLSQSIRFNMSLTSLSKRVRLKLFIDTRDEVEVVNDMVSRLSIKLASLEQPVGDLSGGTQQKVVLAKYLLRQPRVLLLTDPTRGVDVRTKNEIYRFIREWTDDGGTALFYSSDTSELVSLCDRVAVFNDGAITTVLDREELTRQSIVKASFNH